jgi:hypothetical protein
MLNRTASPANFNCCFMTSSSLRRPELSGLELIPMTAIAASNASPGLIPRKSPQASCAPIV